MGSGNLLEVTVQLLFLIGGHEFNLSSVAYLAIADISSCLSNLDEASQCIQMQSLTSSVMVEISLGNQALKKAQQNYVIVV